MGAREGSRRNGERSVIDLNRAERRALVLAAVLLGLGAIVREAWAPGAAVWSWRAAEEDGPGLAAVRERVAEGVEREEEASRPLERGERLDPNTASEEQLRRLPGIGPVRARDIVEARGGGRFLTPEDLLRVRGVGEATLSRLAPHLAFPGSRGPETPAPPSSLRAAPVSSAAAGWDAAPCPGGAVDVNVASVAALERLPWIGPARAREVVEARRRSGGFGSVDELVEVSGIGPYTLEKLRPFVCVR